MSPEQEMTPETEHQLFAFAVMLALIAVAIITLWQHAVDVGTLGY